MEIDKHECRNSRDLYEIYKSKRKICAEDNQRVNIEEICAWLTQSWQATIYIIWCKHCPHTNMGHIIKELLSKNTFVYFNHVDGKQYPNLLFSKSCTKFVVLFYQKSFSFVRLLLFASLIHSNILFILKFLHEIFLILLKFYEDKPFS